MERELAVGLDIETTGLSVVDGHRIIEVAALRYDLLTGELVDKLVTRVNPERSIDIDAQNVHGIKLEDLEHEPLWPSVAPDVHAFIRSGKVVVIHNAQFDAPFVDAELMRVGLQFPVEPAVFCTMENGRWACFDGKLPRLQELCFALGVHYDTTKAHAAEYDVAQMMSCFFRGLKRGFFKPF